MIPEGWRSVQLGELGSFHGGLTYAPNDVVESDGTLVLRSSNIQQGKLVFEDNVLVRDEVAPTTLTQEGDIIVCVRNGSRDLIGKSAQVQADHVGHAHGAFMTLFRPQEPTFARQLFLTERFKREVERDLGATINSINTSRMKRYRFLLPPPDKRAKIAAILSTWDRALETVEALIANAGDQKAALMQALLTGRTRLSGFAGAWTEIRLGQAFTERTDRGEAKLTLLSVTQASGIVPQSDAGRRDISSSDQSNYKTVLAGDIAYNTMRMWQGASAVSALTGKVSPAYTVVTARDGHDVNFYGYLFKLPAMIHVFERHSQGLVSDTWNLKFPLFAKIRVHVPPPDEQRAIAAVLNDAEAKERALTVQRDALREEKAALMQQLLTGKRRVKVEGAGA